MKLLCGVANIAKLLDRTVYENLQYLYYIYMVYIRLEDSRAVYFRDFYYDLVDYIGDTLQWIYLKEEDQERLRGYEVDS